MDSLQDESTVTLRLCEIMTDGVVDVGRCFLNVSGQYRVFSPPQPITAYPGDDVILRCHVTPERNIWDLTIEWSKSGASGGPGQGEGEYVYLYRNRKDDEDAKIRSYVNRTDLWKDALRHGNISLMIKSVRMDDQGTYRCFIPRLTVRLRREKEAVVRLVVLDPNFGRTTESHLDLTTREPIDRIDGTSERHRLVVVFVAAFCVVAILGVAVATFLNVKFIKEKQTGKESVEADLERETLSA